MTKLTFPSLAKFSDFVQLKDYRQPTKDEYVRYVRKLGEHYHCDPATLTEDQLRGYFLFLRQEKKFGGSAMKLARCALRAFFRDCLHVRCGRVKGCASRGSLTEWVLRQVVL